MSAKVNISNAFAYFSILAKVNICNAKSSVASSKKLRLSMLKTLK